MILYALEFAVIAAAVPLMLWLKRRGEHNWEQHRRRMVTIRIIADASRFTAAIAAVGPAMARAAVDLENTMREVAAALKKTNQPAAGGHDQEITTDA